MGRRDVPEINSGSMADIAFMLLIFFLVATTMDVDQGLSRKLPPPVPEIQDDTPPVRERNVFVVLVNKNNQLLVEGKQMDISELRAEAKRFILNKEGKDNMPELVPMDVPYFGTIMVTKKHVISLQNDRSTEYGTYIEVQNELVAAYNELRDELSKVKFGKKYTELSSSTEKEKINAIKKIYPQKISEAEPVNLGGN